MILFTYFLPLNDTICMTQKCICWLNDAHDSSVLCCQLFIWHLTDCWMKKNCLKYKNQWKMFYYLKVNYRIYLFSVLSKISRGFIHEIIVEWFKYDEFTKQQIAEFVVNSNRFPDQINQNSPHLTFPVNVKSVHYRNLINWWKQNHFSNIIIIHSTYLHWEIMIHSLFIVNSSG